MAVALKHLGYLLCLLPPLLLAASIHEGIFWSVPIFFFAVAPCARLLLGDDRAAPWTSTHGLRSELLKLIPLLFAGVWMYALVTALHAVARGRHTAADWAGLWLSMWIVNSLALTIAHELIHQRRSVDQLAGRLLSAALGHFYFFEEHRMHHAHPRGPRDDPDFAGQDETVYGFFARRLPRTFKEALDWEASSLVRQERGLWTHRIAWSATLTAVVAAVFYWQAGWLGFGFYASLALGSHFTIAVITYIQHWGLEANGSPAMFDEGASWQHGCWLQACIMLNHAYHGRHHLQPAAPYFTLNFRSDGLTQPGSFAALVPMTLVPPLFRRVMRRAMAAYKTGSLRRDDVHRNASCLS